MDFDGKNIDYLLTGYGLGLGIVSFLIANLWWRYRSLKADEAALEQLETEVREDAPVKTAYPDKPKSDTAKVH